MLQMRTDVCGGNYVCKVGIEYKNLYVGFQIVNSRSIFHPYKYGYYGYILWALTFRM